MTCGASRACASVLAVVPDRYTERQNLGPRRFVGRKITFTLKLIGEPLQFRRGISYRSEHHVDDTVLLHVIDVDADDVQQVNATAEGRVWCCGWSGPAVQALKTVNALDRE